MPTQHVTEITHESSQSTVTPQPHGAVDIGSFSIFYRNEKLNDWAHVIIAVNISITYQAEDLVLASFDVRDNGTKGFDFLVDGRK